MPVLVVGSANADLVVATERRPCAGETVLGSDIEVIPGGKGANTAVAAGRLGADVALLSAVGSDDNGSLLLRSLTAAGVHTDFVRAVERPTGTAYITVTPDGENSILVSPGANFAVGHGDVDSALRGASVMVASLEVPITTVEHAILAAAKAGVCTVLNLSPTATLVRDTLAAVDVLLVNEHEAGWLLDRELGDPRDLLGIGPRAAVVTLGGRGAIVVDKDVVTEIEVPRVQAVDTTGAGDAFAGALVTALDNDMNLVEAARFATRVAAVAVTRKGAQPSYPKASELAE